MKKPYVNTILVAFFFLVGCSAEKRDFKTVIVLTSADNPPFESFDTHKKAFVGFDIDLSERLAQIMGKKLVVRNIQFDFILPALKSGKGDFALSGITPTETREMVVDFSENYHTLPVYALSNKMFKGVFDRLRIGVQQGSSFEDMLKTEHQKNPTFKIHSLPKLGDIIQELKIKRIDMALMEKEVAHSYQKGTSFKVTPLKER